jgi:hypothetical protein
MNEGMKVHGELSLALRKADGQIVEKRKANMIVDAGFDLIADALGSPTRPALLSHIAVGDDNTNTAAAAGQTALLSEIFRKAATYAHTAGTKTFTLSTTLATGEATGALTEAGVFNADTAGTMFDRVVFDVVNKGADDSIDMTFTFTLS